MRLHITHYTKHTPLDSLISFHRNSPSTKDFALLTVLTGFSAIRFVLRIKLPTISDHKGSLGGSAQSAALAFKGSCDLRAVQLFLFIRTQPWHCA